MRSIKNKKLINQNIFQISQKGEQGIHDLNIYFSYNPILCYLFNSFGYTIFLHKDCLNAI